MRVMSMSDESPSFVSNDDLSSLILSCALFLSSLIFIPTSFFCSAGTLRNSFINDVMTPFLLRYLMRSASISSALLALNASISASIS